MDFMKFNGGSAPQPTVFIGEISVFKRFLSPSDQLLLVEDLRQVAEQAPIFSLKTKSGKPMSVRVTAAGEFGWFSNHQGYR